MYTKNFLIFILAFGICVAIDLEKAGTPVDKDFEEIVVSQHPWEEFNGKYKYIDEWNDQPHFKNENGKHLYFHKHVRDG